MIFIKMIIKIFFTRKIILKIQKNLDYYLIIKVDSLFLDIKYEKINTRKLIKYKLKIIINNFKCRLKNIIMIYLK